MRVIVRADQGCDDELRDRVRLGLGSVAGLLAAVRVQLAGAPDGAGHRCVLEARTRGGERAHTVAASDADPTEALVFAVRRLRARVLRDAQVPRKGPPRRGRTKWGE